MLCKDLSYINESLYLELDDDLTIIKKLIYTYSKSYDSPKQSLINCQPGRWPTANSRPLFHHQLLHLIIILIAGSDHFIAGF